MLNEPPLQLPVPGALWGSGLSADVGRADIKRSGSETDGWAASSNIDDVVHPQDQDHEHVQAYSDELMRTR